MLLSYFMFSMNSLFIFFYMFNSHYVSNLVVNMYLIICWLFFIISCSFSFLNYDMIMHVGLSFFISISMDSFTFMFIFLVLLVFSSWYMYLNYYQTSYYNNMSFFYLFHISLSVLFMGNVALFVMFLEFLSMPMFFMFMTLKSNDWLVGLYFLFFYSSLTGMFLLMSVSHMLHFDFFWLFSFSNFSYLYPMFLSLLVKSSAFPFHSWLPYVHGLCSTTGSVYLAGVFLKLGSYGLISLYNLLSFTDFMMYFQFLFVFLSVLGMLMACFASFVQLDFKKFMAFCSVFHMNFTMLVLFLGGYYASMLVWLSHGFITSLLFYLFGYAYSMMGSKVSFFFGNMMYTSLWYFLFMFLLVLDLGLPPFISFYAEMLSFYYVWYWSYYLFYFMLMVFVFACFMTGNSILSFSMGFSSSVLFDLTLPFFYLYSTFMFIYLFISFNFVSFEFLF